MSVHLPGNKCPACDYKLDGASSPGREGAVPSEGDLSVCINCASLLEFVEVDGALRSRLLDMEKLFELPDEVRLEIMRYHRATVRLLEGKHEFDGKRNSRSLEEGDGTSATQSGTTKTSSGND